MDDQGFDRLARAAAAGRSRRAAVRAIAGAAGGLLAALGGRRGGGADDKVRICHLTGSETNPFVLIEVAAAAVPDHEAHGDAINPDFSSDPEHCNGCGNACGAGQGCFAGSCSDCGAADEPCCPPVGSCGAGLTCDAGTCQDGCRPVGGSCTHNADCCAPLCCQRPIFATSGVCDTDCFD